jgi:predicted nucleotidyltransferase
MPASAPAAHRAAVARFTTACREDARVAAAFVGGSYAAGTADEHSDLDLYVVVEDGGYGAFFADRVQFLHRMGTPLLAEDFDGFGFDMVAFLMEDGVEGEVALGRTSRFSHIHGGPHRTLIDRTGILDGIEFALLRPSRDEQRTAVRRHLAWFWRELSLFTGAAERGRAWTALGYLDDARRRVVNLVRIEAEPGVWAEGYAGADATAGDLGPVAATLTPLDVTAQVEGAVALAGLVDDLGPRVAARFGLDYPRQLAAAVGGRIRDLR